MTMGNKTSSAHFTLMMNKIMYMVLIEHLVFFIYDLLLSTALRMAGLKLKPSKRLLFKKSVDYMGYQVSAEGVCITDKRAKAVKTLRPQNSQGSNI